MKYSYEKDAKIVNMREAKTHLSRLIAQAIKGESFIIANNGKPLVRVAAIDPLLSVQPRRLGFMAGQFTVPDDFDSMGRSEIEKSFSGKA